MGQLQAFFRQSDRLAGGQQPEGRRFESGPRDQAYSQVRFPIRCLACLLCQTGLLAFL